MSEQIVGWLDVISSDEERNVKFEVVDWTNEIYEFIIIIIHILCIISQQLCVSLLGSRRIF